jgi:hypothetical protein
MALNNTVSDRGAVYFTTIEKLLQGDENEAGDVYEYDGGEGPTAQLRLISTGKSELPSFFVNATRDGSNVFFLTEQTLLRSDTRTADYDLYDARVGGGFSEPPPPAACEEEKCHASYTATVFSAPGSASVSGPGNTTEVKCGKRLVRKHGRCVSRRRRRHSNKHHRGRHRRSRGHHHRGAR